MTFALYFYEREVLIVSELNAVSKATIILRDLIIIKEDEVAFIAMYIKAVVQNKFVKNHVGVVAIDMPLTESYLVTYKKIIKISEKIDEGKGILFLVDMGSLVNIVSIFSENFGIKARTIDRVDLLAVLEGVRKAFISENDLDSI
jgi:transcriptional regulatory protein LevR